MKGKLYTTNFRNISKAIGVKIAVSRYTPSWIDPLEYKWIVGLAPSPMLLKSYKDEVITWDEFSERYKIGLNEKIKPLIEYLDKGIDITILCYEAKDKHCHRHIISDKIKEMGYEVAEL